MFFLSGVVCVCLCVKRFYELAPVEIKSIIYISVFVANRFNVVKMFNDYCSQRDRVAIVGLV